MFYEKYHEFTEKYNNSTTAFAFDMYEDMYKEWLYKQNLKFENRMPIEVFINHKPKYNDYFIGLQCYDYWSNKPNTYIHHFLWLHNTLMGWTYTEMDFGRQWYPGCKGKRLYIGEIWKDKIKYYKSFKNLGKRILRDVNSTNFVIIPMTQKEWQESKYYGTL